MIALTSTSICSVTSFNYTDRPAPIEDLIDERGGGHAMHDYFYFSIPKVCSSSLSYMKAQQGPDTIEKWNPDRKEKPVIIVRDPISRWLSGTLEFMSKFSILDMEAFLNQEVYDIGFDRHTAPQSWFLPYNLDWGRLEIFYYSPTVLTELQALGHFPGMTVEYRNITSGNDKKEIFPRLAELFADKDFQDRIRDFYRRDYELITFSQNAMKKPGLISNQLA